MESWGVWIGAAAVVLLALWLAQRRRPCGCHEVAAAPAGGAAPT